MDFDDYVIKFDTIFKSPTVIPKNLIYFEFDFYLHN